MRRGSRRAYPMGVGSSMENGRGMAGWWMGFEEGRERGREGEGEGKLE